MCNPLQRRESSHEYTMNGACSVAYQGDIHFFGGILITKTTDGKISVSNRQHFVIEKQRRGKLVKMTQKKDLDIGFQQAACSSFKMTTDYFSWSSMDIVVLCFGADDGAEWAGQSCYSFHDELTYIGDSNFPHAFGELTNYKQNLLTVGGLGGSHTTELLKQNKNGSFIWSQVRSDFQFTGKNSPRYSFDSYKSLHRPEDFTGHSLVTVPPSDVHEEYVLLIGGVVRHDLQTKVFKFNGTWFHFGRLNKSRESHSSIYWNGAVYVIGGSPLEAPRNQTEIPWLPPGARNPWADTRDVRNQDPRKIEVWKIEDSPDIFKSSENWPDLYNWDNPHLFIVPDSFFPDD